MRLTATLALLAVAAVLGLAACGGDDDESGTTTTATIAATTTETSTDGDETRTEDETETTTAAGDPAAGRELFSSTGCGSCHVLAAAGSSGAVGPNLDERLEADAENADEELADFARDSIEDPGEYVAEGYPAGTMPEYDEQLSDDELDDLVAFIVQSVQ